MTSREALNKLFMACDNDLLYEQSGILFPNELVEIIEKDLNHLEKENSYLKLLYDNMIKCITKFNDKIIDYIQDFNNKECE